MKDYRDKEMRYLLVVYILLLLIWCTATFDRLPNTFENNLGSILKTLEGVVISGVLSLVTFLCDSLITSYQKDKLVGLFFIPRPGNTIFSRIATGKVIDDRFTSSEAITLYSYIIDGLPLQEKEKRLYENSQWYKIYCKHQEKGAISQAQTDYLLCRDLYVETLVFIVLYIISLIVFSSVVFFSWKFIITVILMAIVTNFATHKKMNRFVNNVIAIDIAADESKKIVTK